MPILATAATVSLALAALYFAPWLWKRSSIRELRSRLARERTIVLTYDDGPSISVTPPLLRLLASYNAKATFFMLGEHAANHPEIVDRVASAGHQIGCHSQRHLNAWFVPPWRAIRDIEAGYRSLARWIRPNEMFRPPYGKMTLPTYAAIRRRGAAVSWWTIDSGDTFNMLPPAHELAERVVHEGGGVVLMHDGHRSAERNAFVLEASIQILERAKREGFRVRPLGDVC